MRFQYLGEAVLGRLAPWLLAVCRVTVAKGFLHLLESLFED